MANSPSAIQTVSGVYFDVLAPSAADVRLHDIAHGLAHQGRFTGHTRYFHSIAEHSLFVADLVVTRTGSRQYELAALLHDASEAYLCDLPRPIKHHTALGEIYRSIERPIMSTIAEAFQLENAFDREAVIAVADHDACPIEAMHLMGAPQWAREQIEASGISYLVPASLCRFQGPRDPGVVRDIFIRRVNQAQHFHSQTAAIA